MRTVLTRAAGVLLAGLLASSAPAADVRPVAASSEPQVHRMVILNGPTQTVHYFSVGLSTSDQAALRDLESAENTADYAADLQAMRRQYVAEELLAAPQRAVVQQGLYGKSITRSYDNYLAAAGYGPGYYEGGYYGAGNPGYLYGGYGYGYGVNTAFAGSSSSINQSLANGVGDEGALKTAMAPVIAGQANSEFGASAARAYKTALNRAGESDATRAALGMPKRGVETVDLSLSKLPHATLTFKAGAGDKVDGVIVDEDDDWITVETATDEVSVRKAELARIDRHKK